MHGTIYCRYIDILCVFLHTWDMCIYTYIAWFIYIDHKHLLDSTPSICESICMKQASCPANTTCRRLQASNNVISTAVKETPRQLSLGEAWCVLLFWVGDRKPFGIMILLCMSQKGFNNEHAVFIRATIRWFKVIYMTKHEDICLVCFLLVPGCPWSMTRWVPTVWGEGWIDC